MDFNFLHLNKICNPPFPPMLEVPLYISSSCKTEVLFFKKVMALDLILNMIPLSQTLMVLVSLVQLPYLGSFSMV